MEKNAVIIGAGFAAEMHIEALKKIGIPVKAVISGHKESAEKFAAKHKIQECGTNADSVIDDSVTTIHICTPPASHAAFIKKYLESGNDIICEKPLCLSDREAAEIIQIAGEYGKPGKKTGRLVVDYNVRFFAAAAKMRKIVTSGKLGEIILIHGNYMQEYHALPAIYDWRYRSDAAGSMRAVTEIGSHWFDLAQYVSGSRIAGVSATFKKASEYRILSDGIMSSEKENMEEDFGDKKIHVDSEDAAAVTMRFANGAMGNVLLSEVSHGRGNHLFIEIDMTDGSVWWNEEEPNRIYYGKKNRPVSVELDAFENGFNESISNLFRAFYFGGAETGNLPDVNSGAQIVKICNAVYESSRQHSAWINVKQ